MSSESLETWLDSHYVSPGVEALLRSVEGVEVAPRDEARERAADRQLEALRAVTRQVDAELSAAEARWGTDDEDEARETRRLRAEWDHDRYLDRLDQAAGF